MRQLDLGQHRIQKLQSKRRRVHGARWEWAWPPSLMERIVGLDDAAVADAVQEAHAVAFRQCM